jgi:type VI secretion system protein ImpG
LGKPQLWRLISQLSLNYLSLEEGGAEGLRELLQLHNFADTTMARGQIQGISEVHGSPSYARIISEHGITFTRGHKVEIEFDEERFAGGSVYLLASVLERFLGAYVSLNSFCTLVARSKQRRGVIREWAPRSGQKALL